MEPVTSASLIEFFTRLGENSPNRTVFYLLGGSALKMLGNARQTLDIDYTTNLRPDEQQDFERLVEQVASELQLDVESVPIAEFIPLPPDAASRSRFIAHYGNLEVHLFDLYTIALSKIARGFETDFEDILFMLQQGLIDLPKLERHYQTVLPDVSRADIDPQEFKQNFDWVKQRFRN